MIQTKKKPTVISYKKHEQYMDGLIRKIKDLEGKLKVSVPSEVIEALEFYGDRANYKLIKSYTHYTKVIKDGGIKARSALDAINDRWLFYN